MFLHLIILVESWCILLSPHGAFIRLGAQITIATHHASATFIIKSSPHTVIHIHPLKYSSLYLKLNVSNNSEMENRKILAMKSPSQRNVLQPSSSFLNYSSHLRYLSSPQGKKPSLIQRNTHFDSFNDIGKQTAPIRGECQLCAINNLEDSTSPWQSLLMRFSNCMQCNFCRLFFPCLSSPPHQRECNVFCRTGERCGGMHSFI